jgi:hypothetical protein
VEEDLKLHERQLYIEDNPPMEGCQKSLTAYTLEPGKFFLGTDDLFEILKNLDGLLIQAHKSGLI